MGKRFYKVNTTTTKKAPPVVLALIATDNSGTPSCVFLIISAHVKCTWEKAILEKPMA